jgi:hypothetical protein
MDMECFGSKSIPHDSSRSCYLDEGDGMRIVQFPDCTDRYAGLV